MRLAFLSIALVSATALFGCSTTTTDTTPTVVVQEPTGQLTLTWTVAGAASPSACLAYDADALEVNIFDSSGRQADTEFANCEDFALTVELGVDVYSADATLVDVNDAAVSTTLPLDDLRVTDGTELTVDIDFPDSSML